jgi:hypothetical protein
MNTITSTNLTNNTMTKTNINAIIPEMEAQVAREIPEPSGGFTDKTQRRDFEKRRLTRLFALAEDIQSFLDTHCQDETERQMTVEAYRQQAALQAARN